MDDCLIIHRPLRFGKTTLNELAVYSYIRLLVFCLEINLTAITALPSPLSSRAILSLMCPYFSFNNMNTAGWPVGWKVMLLYKLSNHSGHYLHTGTASFGEKFVR